MSQMILSGSAAAISVTKSQSPLSMTASTIALRRARDVRLDAVDHARREAARHDPPQPRVARVVHVDHRAEELVEGGRHVADVRALAGAEELRLAADLEDVGVLA